MKHKKYFCYEIYKNLAIWSHNGKLGYNPCSFFNGYIKTSTQFNLTEVWNGPEHNQLKHCVENDIPIKGCQDCYIAESNGLESRRLGSKKLYENFHQDVNIDLDGPQGLDYSVGNLCNLKCTICGPSSSSRWIQDYQQLYPLKSMEQFQFEKYNQIEVTNCDMLKNITSVHFHGGGEPLLAETHINLLKQIDQVKGLSDVRVFYNTNGTQSVPDSVLELWAKCRLVELYFSLDDVKQRFNYQRTGANWDQVVANLTWFLNNMPHNHLFNINCTWGYLNLFYLDELVDWHHANFATNRYGDPINLIFQKAAGTYSLNYISSTLHSLLLQKFSNYPELLALVNTLEISDLEHNKFWSDISRLDQVRRTNFKTLCPEWSSLIS